jgi:hypothetical protein
MKKERRRVTLSTEKPHRLQTKKPGAMIVFIKLNLKKILKKRKNLTGSVPNPAQSVNRTKSGVMVLY